MYCSKVISRWCYKKYCIKYEIIVTAIEKLTTNHVQIIKNKLLTSVISNARRMNECWRMIICYVMVIYYVRLIRLHMMCWTDTSLHTRTILLSRIVSIIQSLICII